MTAMLDVQGLGKFFVDGDRQIQVLEALSFSVNRGQSLAVTGPSGAGKSTLLNLLAGLLVPDEGDITLYLRDEPLRLADLSEKARTSMRRQYIGYVYQFFNLVPTLTVLENVRLPARLNREPALETHARELLVNFGLGDRLDVFPEVLSGGEQQRVAVARALVLSPPLLLADEPTGNLDAANTQQVADLLFNTAREMNVGLIIATHNPEVAAMADAQLQMGQQEKTATGHPS